MRLVLTWIFFGNQKSWLCKWVVFRLALGYIYFGCLLRRWPMNWWIYQATGALLESYKQGKNKHASLGCCGFFSSDPFGNIGLRRPGSHYDIKCLIKLHCFVLHLLLLFFILLSSFPSLTFTAFAKTSSSIDQRRNSRVEVAFYMCVYFRCDPCGYLASGCPNQFF